MKTKECSRCHETKECTMFAKSNDRRVSWCRACQNVYAKFYYQQNKERAKTYMKQYYKSNRDRVLNNAKKYYYDHRNERLEYARKHASKRTRSQENEVTGQ